jgi:hypothetical protein
MRRKLEEKMNHADAARDAATRARVERAEREIAKTAAGAHGGKEAEDGKDARDGKDDHK